MDRRFRTRRIPAQSGSKGSRRRSEYHGLLLRPLHTSCALRSAAGESGCPAWLSGPAPASGGSWDDGLDLAAAADFSGSQACEGSCHGAGSWLCPTVFARGVASLLARTGAGDHLGPPPRPQETKAFGRVAPGTVLRSRVPNQGEDVALNAHTPQGACGQEKQARVSYYRGTGDTGD